MKLNGRLLATVELNQALEPIGAVAADFQAAMFWY